MTRRNRDMALASVDQRAARDFVAAELGPLAAKDDDTRRLAATLRAYHEERSSPPSRGPAAGSP